MFGNSFLIGCGDISDRTCGHHIEGPVHNEGLDYLYAVDRSFGPFTMPASHLPHLLQAVAALRWAIFIATCLLVALAAIRSLKILRPQIKFIWHCFLRPIGAGDQRTRLDKVHTDRIQR
jgi:hypothetical protein